MSLLLNYTFSGDATSTLLQSCATETGGPWAINSAFGSSSASVTAAKRIRGNFAGASVYYAPPTFSDGDVEADLYVASNVSNAGILARSSSSAATYYALQFIQGTGFTLTATGGTGALGTYATLGTSLTVSSTYHLRLSLKGTNIRAYVNGVEIFNVTDSSIAGPGGSGVIFSAADSDSTGLHLANIQMSPSVADPLTDTNLFASPYNWESVGGSGSLQSNNVLATGTTAIRTSNPGAYLKFNVNAAANGYCNLELDTSMLGTLSAPSAPTLGFASSGGTVGAVIPAPSAPTVSNSPGTGGTLTAATYWVIVTYVNAAGETVGSTASSQAISGTQELTITSPAAAQNATGWYAYVGNGSTQPANTAMFRQQAAGSPTAIGTNLVITTTPTSTGANPPAANSAWLPYNVEVTYTNGTGETVASASAAVTPTSLASTLTITSPVASGNANGWYAYVTQPNGATYYRQQLTPTNIGTNLTLTAAPTTSGANPPGANTTGVTAANCPEIGVSVDGGAFTYTLLVAQSSGVKRVYVGTFTAGIHSVFAYFRSINTSSTTAMGDRWNGSVPDSSVKINFVEFDGKGTVSAPPTLQPNNLIVWGDSHTEGMDTRGSAQAVGDNDSLLTYAFQLAEYMNAEVGIVAWCGQGWSASFGHGNVPKFIDTVTPSNSTWNLYRAGLSRLIGGSLSPVPKYAAVMLGRNDAALSATDAAVTSAVNAFLLAFRAAATTTKLALIVPPDQSKRAAIVAGLASVQDNKIFVADPTTETVLNSTFPLAISSSGFGSNDGIHFNQTGHSFWAGALEYVADAFLNSVTVGGFVPGAINRAAFASGALGVGGVATAGASLRTTSNTGQTIYGVLRNSSDQVFNTSSMLFENYSSANYPTKYINLAVEQGSTGYYVMAAPGGLPAGDYLIDFRTETVMGSPAVSDQQVAAVTGVRWDLVRWSLDQAADSPSMAYGTAQGGPSGTQITLALTEPATANHYNGCQIALLYGTGRGQSRTITGYTTGRVATVDRQWDTTPDATTIYAIGRGGVPLDANLNVQPVNADGLTYMSCMELIMAILGGVATVSGNTVIYDKRDGVTNKITIVLGTAAGVRTSSTINN